MSNIYERIGEALLSNGQHDIIRAESKHEEVTLTNAGFTKVGSIKEGDKIIALFKIEQKTKEVLKIVEVPKKDTYWPYNNDKSYPFGRPNPGIWYYNDHNPLYTYGTGTGDSSWMQYKGNTISGEYTDNMYTNSFTNKNDFLWSDLDNGFNMSAELYKMATLNTTNSNTSETKD